MADIVKMASVLNIECAFLDGDTRTITLKNPRSDISASDIESLETFMQTENIIIGDRDSSDFRKIKRAVKRDTTTKYLDLE
ncbi:MAG: hypothetical protein IJL12_05975 [Selenomonadaceae bacterium]|nr:hypothetical protein [Selenomonadaceae bacterium]MBQ6131870.1 hypothetical protein [Selenomonadaceae bacterium]